MLKKRVLIGKGRVLFVDFSKQDKTDVYFLTLTNMPKCKEKF